MNLITSSQNQVIKEIKALKQKKYREEQNRFFIEGLRFVEEGLNEKADIAAIIQSNTFFESELGKKFNEKNSNPDFPVYIITDKLFLEICETENPQGISAVVGIKSYTIEEIIKKGKFILILENIQDPGNLGTIIRTADASGVAGIIISKGCVDPYNAKVLRSTMGSIFHVSISCSEDIILTLKELKSMGYKIYATHLKAEQSYFEVDYNGNIAVVIGNEAKGVSETVTDFADFLVKIPMPGKAESLNAAVAAGLLMYEAVRQGIVQK